MDKTKICRNQRNTIKTDLTLLLECLKFQMKCPDLQKQALLTIHSICEKREDNVDLLREMGGVAFVYNLSKSSIVHPDVKETALFTLGTLAEANVYCKNSLCKKETFADLADCLMKEDIPLKQKRLSVYLLLVLVANNKLGQTLAQTSGCLDVLLNLFRATFPISTEATFRAANATQTYQLWTSVSSALCGCVNNPQNEEGQRICVAAFPVIKIWLQQLTFPQTEIFQPICTFIAMTVANNSCVQESFSACGGLETLALTLGRLASAADTSLLSCQLSVIISKTLSACITDNSSLASGLAQYDVVLHLFSLLASPHLDPQDRLPILLSLGYCTEASEKHQSQLIWCGGLSIIITLLTEDSSEEVRRAATFILQTCKKATMCSGVGDLMANEDENVEASKNIEGFRSSAREMLHRINLLEKRKDVEGNREDTNLPNSNEGRDQISLPALNLPLHIPQKEGVEAIPRNITERRNNGENKELTSGFSSDKETSEGDVRCSMCKGTGVLMSSHFLPLEGASKQLEANSQRFKPLFPVRYTKPSEIKCIEELQHTDMENVIKAPVRYSRCAACVLPFEEVTSHTFESLQSSCHQSCDRHKFLREATECFKMHHCKLVFEKEHQDAAEAERYSTAEPQRSCKNWTGRSEGERKVNNKNTLPERRWRKHNGVTLVPLQRRAKKTTFASHNRTDIEMGGRSGHHNSQLKIDINHSSTKRKRKDFSCEEVGYLLSGVKTYGFSWNLILWSYPFQPGRTNVDLAKKYRRIMKHKAQDASRADS
ncbi:telomere repeats-binding bouquet formation protein 1 isoform X1 [Oreochromis niloticus]|uniref:telomere repeats-binding bouquet formation protein 1 isoform X1 n=1 Tax=Oreochromis niloticus TaxID=8128 RepID=UPI00025FB9BA|nr:telomere repeats-binding bouquet formation protein 1 isoform X1 [Oreochromis niloticus]